MKKYIIILTKDERKKAYLDQNAVDYYQTPICRTNKIFEKGQFFVMKLMLPDIVDPTKERKQKVLVEVEKVVKNIIFVKIPCMESIK